MEALNRINGEIFELREQQKYVEALSVYKNRVHKVFSTGQIKKNDRLVANVLHCLRKTGRSNAALHFFNETLVLIPQQHSYPQVYNEYGWCLYFRIKETPPGVFSGQLPNYIRDAVEFAPTIDFKKNYLLFNLLIQELSKKLMQKGEAALLLSRMLNKLEPQWFRGPETKTTNAMKEPGTHTPEKAPDLETFLMRKAKTFLLNGEFTQCIETCNLAFEKINKFHHGNNLWLARNLAIALQQTGKLQMAMERMKDLLKKKKDWFLYRELAGMYWANNQPEKAMLNICRAALAQGHSSYKVGLYEEMGTMYKQGFSASLTCETLWLAIKTRMEKNWKLSQELSQHAIQHNCIEPRGSATGLYHKLSIQWGENVKKYEQNAGNQQQQQPGLHCQGKITRILNPGENGDGFITDTKGKSIYFRVKKTDLPAKELREGIKVKAFARLRQYKGKQVYNALWVKKIV